MTLASWVEKWALVCPDKTAIEYDGQAISYGDFHQKIIDTAAMLHDSLGIRRGDRVAFLGQNHPRIFYLLFACARIGAIFVPLNWRLTATEHHHMLSDSGASVFFVEEAYQNQCEPLLEKLPDCCFVTIGGTAKPGWVGLQKVLRTSQGQDPVPRIDLKDPVLIIFTSGTTGFPKGAVLTQGALEANVLNSIHMHDMTHDDVILTILPMFHVGGLNIQTTAAFCVGATVLLHQNFDPGQTIDAINNDRPSLMIMLPAHMGPLRDHEKWPTADFSSLRVVTTGSCVVPDAMTSFWHQQQIPLIQVYGSSETCPIAIHQTAKNAFATEGSIGFPAKHCEVRIVDGDGRDCAVDQAGEILIKGHNIMAYYWNDADATARALKDGWFHTGDIGTRDKGGCYHFVDRQKDVIISGGENIYPAELETVLAGHPEIEEAAVVGKPDGRWGEVAVAFIVPQSGHDLSQDRILDWLGDRLGRYKHPREMHFIDRLPRNEMRKVMKDELRRRLAK
ncbi:MAG: AMP-binding protein [Rhodobacteraceae bacterium]|nr:AMP-binding protein [Paracoccaceae bacterium]